LELAAASDKPFLIASVQLWTLIAVASALLGNLFAWRVMDCSPNVFKSSLLSAGFILLSIVMCRGVTKMLQRDARANAILRAFLIPIGAIGPLSLGGIAFSGMQYLSRVGTQMCGLNLTLGLSYIGAIVWGVIVRRRLKLTNRQPDPQVA
jgi:hypothetical protein